ncbi:MAG: Asp-tRNA(Asn)/Glu-tRNA(Gln) amidotransferase subunit GatC [Gemmatimonadaceae bacterium]|nr:Asp-tRNA(Asn)/Glu-tRNA(Gln) amidotransferase subunit GatC [Gemmatimonadaceae bacterium]
MSVSEVDLRHIATLSRLGLDPARVPALVGELNRILEHMDVLQQVDVTGIDPDARALDSAPLRPDAVAPLPFAHPREHFAPAMRDGFFLVPRLATHADEAADE